VDFKLLLATAIKFADLGHSLKTFWLHEEWSMRISREFWRLGDREKELGVPISPLCDREADHNIAKSQVGFFQFICIPFFSTVADLVDPEMPPYKQLQENFHQWKDVMEPSFKEVAVAVSASFHLAKKRDSPPTVLAATAAESTGADAATPVPPAAASPVTLAAASPVEPVTASVTASPLVKRPDSATAAAAPGPAFVVSISEELG